MRADFHSVVTDGNALRYPDACRYPVPILDDDDAPRPIGRTRGFSKGWREGRNFRHSLVRRYLRSQVGRPFDAVRSDICHAVRGSSLRDDLILDEVERLVAKRRGTNRNGRPDPGTPYEFRYWAPDFFVDAGGLLQAEPNRGRQRSWTTREALRLLTDPDLLPLSDPRSDQEEHAVLERVSGVWYLRTWKRVPSRIGTVGSHASRSGRQVAYFDDLEGFRRQLASVEIRRLGLDAWAHDAAVLSESVSGRRFDGDASRRQQALRNAAVRNIGSNPARRGRVASR